MIPLQVPTMQGFQNNLQPLNIMGQFTQGVMPAMQQLSQQKAQADAQAAQIAEAQRHQESDQQFQAEMAGWKAQQEAEARQEAYREKLRTTDPKEGYAIDLLKRYQTGGDVNSSQLLSAAANQSGISKQELIMSAVDKDDLKNMADEMAAATKETIKSNQMQKIIDAVAGKIKSGTIELADIGAGLMTVLGSVLGANQMQTIQSNPAMFDAINASIQRGFVDKIINKAEDTLHDTITADRRTEFGVIDSRARRNPKNLEVVRSLDGQPSNSTGVNVGR